MDRLQPHVFAEIAQSLIPLANSPRWLKALWVEKELEARDIWNMGVTELIRPFLSPDDPWNSELQLDDLTPEQAELASLIHLLAISKRLNSSPVRRLPKVEPVTSPVTAQELATQIEIDVVLWSEARRPENDVRSEFTLSSDMEQPAQTRKRVDLPTEAKDETHEADVTDADLASSDDPTVQTENGLAPVVMWSESRRPESEIQDEFEYSMNHSEPVQVPEVALLQAEAEEDEPGEANDLPEFDLASWSTPWTERDDLRDWPEIDAAVTSFEEAFPIVEESLPVAQSPDAPPKTDNDVESDTDQLGTVSWFDVPSFEKPLEDSRPDGVELPLMVEVDLRPEAEPEEIDTPATADATEATPQLDASTGDRKSEQQDTVVSAVVAEDSSKIEAQTLEEEAPAQPVVNAATPDTSAEKDAELAETSKVVSPVQKTPRKAKSSKNRTARVKASKGSATSKTTRKPRKLKPVVAEQVVAKVEVESDQQIPAASADVATPKKDQVTASGSESTAPTSDVQRETVKPAKAHKKRTVRQQKRTANGKSKRASVPIVELKPAQAVEPVSEKVAGPESEPTPVKLSSESVASAKKTRKPARQQAQKTRSTKARTARVTAKTKKSETTQLAPLKLVKPAASKAVTSTTRKSRKSTSPAKASEANSPAVKLDVPQAQVIPFTESVAEQDVTSTAKHKTSQRKKTSKQNRLQSVAKPRKATSSRPKSQEHQQSELAETPPADMSDAAGVADLYGLHIDNENESDRGKLLFFDSVIKTHDGDWDSSDEQLESALESLDDSVQSRIWKQAIEQSLKIRRKLDRPDAA